MSEMSTRLIQATRDLLALRRGASTGETELARAARAFTDTLRSTRDPEVIRMALDQDADELLLPPELKDAAYERLLELRGRDPDTLREYAWHLQIYGPDRDEEAESFLAEADRADPPA